MTVDIHPMANEEKGREMSLLTSPSESYVEKLSPAPDSIHSSTPMPESNEANNDKSVNVTDDDETLYPPNITKFAVGVGLALAIFLVQDLP
jgi:hypothetical protein